MLKRSLLLCCLLLGLICTTLHAQVHPTELTTMSSNIKEKLIDLKVNSAIVTEQLNQVLTDLKLSQQEAQDWKERSMNLSNSLMSINEQLNKCYTTIDEQSLILDQKTATIDKCIFILVILVGIFVIGIVIKVVFIIMYAKGIKVPRLVDILA